MRKLRGLLTISFIIIFSISTQAQSLSKLSDTELEIKKKEAITSENFELAKEIKIEQDSRKSIDDKLKEKNLELATALKNEDFAKAETLKKEIKQLEETQAKLKVLEEDKKIAVFKEDYDKVMALETEINNLRKGTSAPTITSNNNTVTPTTTPNTTTPNAASVIAGLTMKQNTSSGMLTMVNGAKQTKIATKKVNLSDVDFSDKVISQAGIGFGTITETYQSYNYFSNSYYNETYTEGIFAMSYLANRWWVNKYLVGGWNLDFAPSDYGSMAVGGQMAAFGDFDAIILPYTSLGLGFGMDLWDEEIYMPFVFRVGSYLFINQSRSFGFFTEFNLYVNHDYMPKIRFGLAWSKVKSRAKK